MIVEASGRPPKLSGSTCLCAACGLYFGGISTFDRHRYFIPGTDERGCRDAEWLSEHGLTLTLGTWKRPAPSLPLRG